MKRFNKLAILALLFLGAIAQASAGVVVRGRYYPRRHHARHVIVFGAPTFIVSPVYYAGRPAGALDMDVSPEDTRVYVDGRYRGVCDDFDGFPSLLYLRPGSHQIELETPDGETYSERVRVRAGERISMDLRLES
jgi:hypothetical protein